MTAKKTSFAKDFEELEKITEWFEQGEVDLEEALTRFERGLALVKLLQGHLKNVENKVVEIKKQFGRIASERDSDANLRDNDANARLL